MAASEFFKDEYPSRKEDIELLTKCFKDEMMKSVQKSDAGEELFRSCADYDPIFMDFTRTHLQNQTPWNDGVSQTLKQLIWDGSEI